MFKKSILVCYLFVFSCFASDQYIIKIPLARNGVTTIIDTAPVDSTPSETPPVADPNQLPGTIGYGSTCKRILTKDPSSINGIYTITLSSSTSATGRATYCDMTGGGWTAYITFGSGQVNGYSASRITDYKTFNYIADYSTGGTVEDFQMNNTIYSYTQINTNPVEFEYIATGEKSSFTTSPNHIIISPISGTTTSSIMVYMPPIYAGSVYSDFKIDLNLIGDSMSSNKIYYMSTPVWKGTTGTTGLGTLAPGESKSFIANSYGTKRIVRIDATINTGSPMMHPSVFWIR